MRVVQFFVEATGEPIGMMTLSEAGIVVDGTPHRSALEMLTTMLANERLRGKSDEDIAAYFADWTNGYIITIAGEEE